MLYPIGVGSELTMAWLALPALRDSKLWSIEMPNSWNFGFSYYVACVLAMITYIPGARGRGYGREKGWERALLELWLQLLCGVCAGNDHIHPRRARGGGVGRRGGREKGWDIPGARGMGGG